MKIKKNIRFSVFPSEVLSILKTKLDASVFNAFKRDDDKYKSDKNQEISKLSGDIDTLNKNIATNTNSIKNLSSVKADKSESLRKDSNGNYTSSNMIKSNKYSFFEDETTYLERVDANNIGITVKGTQVLKISNTGDITLTQFAGKAGEVLVITNDGVITTNGVKLKIGDDGSLLYFNGSTWVR